MQVFVNGDAMELAAEATVAALLARLGRAPAWCAVEVNAALVPKARHAAHRLAPGDRVEVVTLVGGG